MDGLMVDTEHLHHQSFKATLEKRGINPIPNEQGIIHVSGISSEDNWKNFKKQYNFEADSADLSRDKHEFHLQLLKENVTAMPGLLKLLEKLKANHIKMAIASSSVRQQIDLITSKLEISDFFDAVISGEDIKNGKPAPDIFLSAAKALQVDPKECVVLEDATSGVSAGKAAGMRVIAVPNEFNKHEDFKDADIVLDSLEKVDMNLLALTMTP